MVTWVFSTTSDRRSIFLYMEELVGFTGIEPALRVLRGIRDRQPTYLGDGSDYLPGMPKIDEWVTDAGRDQPFLVIAYQIPRYEKSPSMYSVITEPRFKALVKRPDGHGGRHGTRTLLRWAALATLHDSAMDLDADGFLLAIDTSRLLEAASGA